MGSDKSRKSGTMKISDLVGEIQSVALSSLCDKDVFSSHFHLFKEKYNSLQSDVVHTLKV